MTETTLLVDYENVRELSLARLPNDWRICIFIGRMQNSIPFSLAQEAQALGPRLEWVKIAGDGKNNLDFHLAFYLGVLATRSPKAPFVILSKDKGFDALLAHLVQRGMDCKRVEAFAEVAAAPAAEPGDPHFARAYEVLAKIERKARPRRRATLLQQVASVFQKKLPEPEIQRIVGKLFRQGLVTESANALSYTF